ncbi:MAG: glutathione S-transferase family protein [Geminicoccaceae bacterium]
MLRVWGRPNSLNVQKVMWVVGELGLPHERLDVGGPFGRLDTAEYGRLNPNRRIPTVEDDGTVVWESNACVRYLAARYDAGGLWPEDPRVRARADMWMDWMVLNPGPDLGTCFIQLCRTPADKRDMAAVREAAARLGPVWAIADAALAGRDCIAGDRLTIGDIPLGCAWWRYSNLPIERPVLPHLERWGRALLERGPYRANVVLPLT